MLQPIRKRRVRGQQRSFAIVAAKYNQRYVDALVRHARAGLESAGASVEVIRVPGSFEIPVVAGRLAARRDALAGIICFGVILQGETTHARHIAEGVTHALARLQIDCGIPIIHGVLLFDTPEQARVRCLGKEHNRGTEAAQVALEMAKVMSKLAPSLSVQPTENS